MEKTKTLQNLSLAANPNTAEGAQKDHAQQSTSRDNNPTKITTEESMQKAPGAAQTQESMENAFYILPNRKNGIIQKIATMSK